MQKHRLDQYLATKGLVHSRSEAENWIKLGKVTVDGTVITKPGYFVGERSEVKLKATERYVSRAGLKLASVAKLLGVEFAGKIVLDVGSSTGGFTDYALQHGAKKVIAVDVGTEQLHPSLVGHPKIELHEKTDVRNVYLQTGAPSSRAFSDPGRANGLPILSYGPTAGNVESSKASNDVSPRVAVIFDVPEIIVMDVSFISLREILPHIATLADKATQIVAMVKPQFEAGKHQVNKGVIKNDSVRREILKDFEAWARQYFVLLDKRDSEVAGAKGNRERFYLLKLL